MATRTAFVLGGGGVLGAAEVGMLRALLDAGITPDLVLGTSVGALNGALLAADPTPAGVRRIEALWVHAVTDGPLAGSLRSRVSAIASSRARAASHPGPLSRLLAENLDVENIEDLPVEFACVAASIERAAEHWFTHGPIVPAVLASSALPGLYPPVEIDGEHYLDGGLVNSIPLDRRPACAPTCCPPAGSRPSPRTGPTSTPWTCPESPSAWRWRKVCEVLRAGLVSSWPWRSWPGWPADSAGPWAVRRSWPSTTPSLAGCCACCVGSHSTSSHCGSSERGRPCPVTTGTRTRWSIRCWR